MSMIFDRTLPDVLRLRAELSGDKPFIQLIGREPLSYRETYARSCAIADGLVALGVEHGECVVIMADNAEDSICSWLGIHLAGAVEVAINTAYRGQTLEHALQNCRARTMFVEARFLPRLSEIRDSLTFLEDVIVYSTEDRVDNNWPSLPGIRLRRFADVPGDRDAVPVRTVKPSDIASIVYTSGTTGPAKGVRMPHGQISLFARLGVEGAKMTESDVHFCFIPLFHVAGKFMAIYGSMIAAGKVVIDTQFVAEAWLSRVREYGATLSHMHGPLVEMVFKQPEMPDDSENPVTRIIASPFPAKIAEEFEKRFALRGIETWGMTEVTVPVWQPYEEPLRVGCCGRPRDDHFDVRVVDPDTDEERPRGLAGEIVVRPHRPFTIMQGYLHNPEATLNAWRNLWFHSGDLGYIDDDGYLYFVDRAKERIRRRAENISSYDIEAAALSHSAIREAVAVGVPSEFEGDDDIHLYVILSEGSVFSPQDLTVYLVKLLPHFMIPRYISFVSELARTPTGKPQKSALREAGVTAESWDRKAAGISIRDLV